MEEIWKEIEWYEGKYQISSKGRVKSLKFWKEKMMRLAKLWIYSRVCLYLNWNTNYKSIHRLVAIHFVPNPNKLPCACHKDETLIDWMLYNWMDNLWWWTYSENTKDCRSKWRGNNFFLLNHPKPNLWKFWKDNHLSKCINQYTKNWEFVKTWYSAVDVNRELWINNWSISRCCTWKQKYAGKFMWEYK